MIDGRSEQPRSDQAFAMCQEALFGSNKDALVVHMWEDHVGGQDTPEGDEARTTEIQSVLGVMANMQGVLYDDTGYLLPTGFKSRVESGEDHDGFATLATSAVTSNAPDVWSGTTGLLLLNPEIVFASPTDAWSLFYEKDKHLPETSEWEKMMRDPVVRAFCPARELLMKDVDARNTMGGKLAITAWYPDQLSTDSGQLWQRLVAEQLVKGPADSKDAYGLFLDPFSSSVRERARHAFDQMIANEMTIREEFDGQDIWSEICVAAGIQHIVGILVRNDEKPFAVQPTDWALELQDRPKFSSALQRARNELEVVAAYKTEAGDQPSPAVVIYQPGNTDMPIVHFNHADSTLEQLRR